MTDEELKDTIVYIATSRTFTDSFGDEIVIDREVAKGLADSLIAAGIGDVKEAEHRSEVAERQAMVLSKWLADKTRKDYPYQAWLEAAQKQAERELAEEGKE